MKSVGRKIEQTEDVKEEQSTKKKKYITKKTISNKDTSKRRNKQIKK